MMCVSGITPSPGNVRSAIVAFSRGTFFTSDKWTMPISSIGTALRLLAGLWPSQKSYTSSSRQPFGGPALTTSHARSSVFRFRESPLKCSAARTPSTSLSRSRNFVQSFFASSSEAPGLL